MDARLVSRALAAAVALVAVAACAPAVSFPGREPDAVGTVTDVVASRDAVTFTLTGDDEAEYFWHAAITVGLHTTVGDDQGRPVALDSIASGSHVSVWVGECAESYPVQCTAEALRIDGEGSDLP
ncbi:MAG: hypothetical protein DIU73_002135 [Actinomycetes bacterium]|nr:MAG: hypothetical protein DIU73_06780 [Actinomycetota bacterium]